MPFNWFSKKKPEAPPPAPPPKPPVSVSAGSATSLEKHLENEELWTRKVEVLEQQVVKLRSEAVAAKSAGNTKLALVKLKEMKLKEKDLDSKRQQLTNMQAVIDALRVNTQHIEYVAFMSAANAELKASQVDVDMAADMADALQDVLDNVRDVTDVIARPIGPELDTDDLNDELAQLMAADAEKEATAAERASRTAVKASPAAPLRDPDLDALDKLTVPVGPLPSAQADEDALAELERELA